MLTTKVLISSDLNLKGNSSEKLTNMLCKTGCHTYLVDSELENYLKKEHFENEGFSLKFMNPEIHQYHQLFGDFIPNLSVIDLLLNEGNESRKFILSKNQ